MPNFTRHVVLITSSCISVRHVVPPDFSPKPQFGSIISNKLSPVYSIGDVRVVDSAPPPFPLVYTFAPFFSVQPGTFFFFFSC